MGPEESASAETIDSIRNPTLIRQKKKEGTACQRTPERSDWKSRKESRRKRAESLFSQIAKDKRVRGTVVVFVHKSGCLM